MDCGPTCLQMVASYHGRFYNIETLRSLCGISKTGVSLFGLKEGAKIIGLKSEGLKVTFAQLLTEVKHPSILYWNQKHFVIYLNSKKNSKGDVINIIDPSQGKLTLTHTEFLTMWSETKDEDGDHVGFVLSVIPQKEFYQLPGEKKSVFSWKLVFNYFTSDYSKLFYISLTILFSIACQLFIPFLTKYLVDTAIQLKDVSLITFIVFAQFGILLSKLVSDFLRAKFLLFISTFIYLKMSHDFWKKLTRLPLSFFEVRRGGDIFQRLSDNKQIQNFLTGPAVNTTFSILTLLTFAFVLFSYNHLFLIVFLSGILIYYIWISCFFNIRKKINYNMNELYTRQNDLSLQFVNGMSEIKIGSGERIMLKDWENLQHQLFLLNRKSLRITQIQSTGGLIISQGKDLLIIYLAANLVIEQQITLGVLIAIQYIIGALGSPVEQLVMLAQNFIDVKQSINRINDIYLLKDEEKGDGKFEIKKDNNDIKIKNLCFSYPGIENNYVLRKLNLEIPNGKVTAIVGLSGSGKSTLLKLLLKFYEYYEGSITIGDKDLRNINNRIWRRNCGAVLQEGYIFNNTLERNIAIGETDINYEQLIKSCKNANILEFINSLPNKFKTKLGVDGINLSQGQKQRILIARSVYKDPEFLFFDEATNSLDAENERLIVNNLKGLFFGKTVVVIAHRLSTVKDADKIIVLSNGEIIEEGTHMELIKQNGKYLELVKNQLELSR